MSAQPDALIVFALGADKLVNDVQSVQSTDVAFGAEIVVKEIPPLQSMPSEFSATIEVIKLHSKAFVANAVFVIKFPIKSEDFYRNKFYP